MYKLSKFSHITKYNNETILYNFYHGTKSIVKTHADIDFNNIHPDRTYGFSFLQKKGHIVDSKVDEDLLVEQLYNQYQNRRQLSLIIMPNETCNFRCIYCYETLKHRVMSLHTMDAIFAYVEKNISFFDSLCVSWYGGEPLLSIDIISKLSEKFINICRTHKKYYFATITTNGYLLDLETFRLLRNYYVISYQISIDGFRDTHNKQRPLCDGSGTYDVILNNLVNIKNNIKSGSFKIIIRTNCSKIIMEKFGDYIDELLMHFADDKRFLIFLRPVMDWGGERVSSMSESLLGVEQINEFFYKIIEKDPDGKLSFYMNTLDPTGSVCYAGYKNHLTINSNGEIFKCTCDLDNYQGSKIGKIGNDGDFDINNSHNGVWESNIKNKKAICQSCDMAPVCLYDHCPGSRMFTESLSLPCPFEKYFLDSQLILFSRNKNVAVF